MIRLGATPRIDAYAGFSYRCPCGGLLYSPTEDGNRRCDGNWEGTERHSWRLTEGGWLLVSTQAIERVNT